MNKVEDKRYCYVHKVLVPVCVSPRTGKPYCKHEVGEKTCWVNSQEEIDGFRDKQFDYANDQRGA